MTDTVRALPYRDATLPVKDRVADLLARMSVEQKAALMFHDFIPLGVGGELAGDDNIVDRPASATVIRETGLTHFNVVGTPATAREMAVWHNNVQRAAAENEFGIPVTISTDPRNSFAAIEATSFDSGPFSQWPESLGLAALFDEDAVRTFADMARQEYVAVGIRASLHPQVDLATEPRWARSGMTFGEDADLTSRCVGAYIRGFQGASFGSESVSTMTKHFPGGGPQKDGEDPHFSYGREQIYPGGNFEYHLKPFIAAIAAGARQMMPYYGMPVGTDYEEVAFGFNKGIITDLLRTRLGFGGIVCTDWCIINDATIMGEFMPARAWGVEHLTPIERVEKALNAGVDQFGGESCPELIVELVRTGRVSIDRIDESASRLLAEKFYLGLFDNPFVDEDAADRIVGNPLFVEFGAAAQRAAIVRLTEAEDGPAALPLRSDLRVYSEGVSPAAVARLGTAVEKPSFADVAILRLRAPFESRPGKFESLFHAGSLEFGDAERERILEICAAVPTIVDVYLDRAAIFPEIAQAAAALLVNFGATDDAIVDVLLNPNLAKGRLPFDLPSSTTAVIASDSDVPFDTADPAFRFGAGLL